MTSRRATLRRRIADDEGALGLWIIIFLIPVVLTAIALITEGGLAIASKQRITGLSREAARYAVDQLAVDAYRSGEPGITQASATTAAKWAQSKQQDSSCTGTVVGGDAIKVACTLTYHSALLGDITVTADSTARAVLTTS